MGYCKQSNNELIVDFKKKNSEKYYLKWVQTLKQVNFYDFNKKGKQLVNHIPNILQVLGKKTSLLATLASKKELIESKFNIPLNSFFPEEYRLDILSDLIGFIKSPNKGLWIKKPHGMNCGKGIEMIGNVV